MSTPAQAPAAVLDLNVPFTGVSPLPHLGVIRATGADAANFLHNQLTNDVLLMKDGECRLAAFCNAKGRMQASFVVYKRSAEEVLLICRRNLMAQTVKRLSMFVMRAKAKLSDASDAFQLLGLAGESVGLVLGDASLTAQTLPAWQRRVWVSPLAATTEASAATADVLTLYPALGQPRALWIAPVDVPQPAYAGPVLTPALWQVGEVLSGIAWVEQATFEAFVPQMLNYESVDGVNFKKGCYPGQEIVARSQFRGTLKRRAFIVQSPVPMAAGQEVFSSLDATQPCGLIAQAAQDGAVCVAIAELQLAATDNSTLYLGAAQGPELQRLPLPYPLRDDI
ncbi:folate-binding protein [Limnohabitans sp.]|uniref:CAF17-like 4Fe-4S cluster assembly/insertion protein YgfZ n=1 Tax=Limnohabitans sp. TaxID=1907725 RepID=UPI00286F0DA4|nr:folate-binding protein [Limnohabitans sp.]